MGRQELQLPQLAPLTACRTALARLARPTWQFALKRDVVAA